MVDVLKNVHSIWEGLGWLSSGIVVGSLLFCADTQRHI